MRGKVNPGEVLLKAVRFVEPKMLIGSDQKVSDQGLGFSGPRPQMSCHRLRGTT